MSNITIKLYDKMDDELVDTQDKYNSGHSIA